MDNLIKVADGFHFLVSSGSTTDDFTTGIIRIREWKIFEAGPPDNTIGGDFVVAANGFVGINTVPTQRLHVDGNILATGTITPDYVFQKYYNGESKIKPEYQFNSLEKQKHLLRKTNIYQAFLLPNK